jgi:hypothetical protein
MLTPQPDVTSGGTPERISSTNIFTRALIIEAHVDNTGTIYISDSEANISSDNKHALDAGDRMHFSADNWGDISIHYNIKQLWFDGTTGDKLVVSYVRDDESSYVNAMVEI